MRSAPAVALALVLAACSKSEPAPSAAPAELSSAPMAPPVDPHAASPHAPSPHGQLPAAPAAHGQGAAPASSLSWTAPSRWKVAPSASPMRKATYTIPRAAGDGADAELTVVEAVGGVDANVQRWATQFKEQPKPKVEKRSIAGLDVTVVELEGTFLGGGMMGPSDPQPGTKMLAAIVEGDPETFFKMTGPIKTVSAARGELDQLLASLKKAK